MPENRTKDDGQNGRMCIVTRESGDADMMIRFVAGPDGTVVADLKRQFRDFVLGGVDRLYLVEI